MYVTRRHTSGEIRIGQRSVREKFVEIPFMSD